MPSTLRLPLVALLACLALPLLARAATPPSPADPAAFAAARALLDARKPAEAQAAFEKLAAAHPADPEVQFYLGELALRRNEPAKAVPFLEKAIATAPSVSRYHRRLGDAWGTQAASASIFSQLGFAKKCIAAYEKAVALDPADLDARFSAFEYYRRAPGLAGGGFEKASATAAAIKQLDANRGRFAYATLYVGEKKYAEAFAQFDEVLKTTPDDYAALYQIGRIAAVSGEQVDRGLASLRRCLELPVPTPETPGHAAAHWRIGQLLEKKKDVPGARASYEKSVALDPKFAPAADSLKKLPAK